MPTVDFEKDLEKEENMNEKSRVTVSRRAFLEASLAGASLMGCSAISDKAGAAGKLSIKMAGYDFDRVRPLIDGRVGVKGCDVEFELAAIGDMNTHVFGGPGTREVTEIGLSPFMLAYANEGFRAYTLIPVFPLRLFRHKSIFVRTDRGLSKPDDLKGRRVATPGYSSTSLTWIRGIMQHEYGVAPKEIQWVVSAKDSSAKDAGKASKQESVLPEGLSISAGTPGKDESDLLVDGEVDALFHAAEPRAFVEGNPLVGRLFRDVRATERDYFARTGIFPIMHAVAIRKDVIETNPWLPEAVFNAYSEAKRLNYDAMKKEWIWSSLPWYGQELEDIRELMGDNFWPYGIEANRRTLDALFHAVEPRAFVEGNPLVGRLFRDVRATERDYFRRTGIFPIMHAVAIRRDVIEADPWLPEAVFNAYSEAKQLNYGSMNREWLWNSLPWYGQELEDVRELMGDNFWPYGVEANRKTLEALFRYSYEQGLAKRELRIEELFHPSTLELTESA